MYVQDTNLFMSSLIATPGRLLHLIVEMELDLRTVEYVVFDEADRYVKNECVVM
jgi:superfamily II DNA/RNA helicase